MKNILNPRPIFVKALPDFELEIKFSNNEVKIFSMKPYLNFGVFKEFQDINYFNKVAIGDGTVTWPNEQDICPDTLYEDSRAIAQL